MVLIWQIRKFVTTALNQRLKFESRYPFDKQVLLTMTNRFLILLMILFTGAASFAQETAIYRDPQQLFKQGKEYFQKEQYSLAYPVFRELRHGLREADQVDQPNIYRESLYYSIVCGLMLNQDQAVDDAKRFMELERDQYLKEKISFHLAEYYFRNNKMADAVQAYESSNFINLSNEEISTMKFHQGYAYFTLQRFKEAQPLLYSIAQNEDDPHYEEANYYLGLVEYQQGHFNQALSHLKNVDKHPI
jgi:tetratricopeptide (TPR) repeat protein